MPVVYASYILSYRSSHESGTSSSMIASGCALGTVAASGDPTPKSSGNSASCRISLGGEGGAPSPPQTSSAGAGAVMASAIFLSAVSI